MNEIHGSSGKKSSLHDRSKMKIRDSNGCGVMVVCEHALIFCVTSDSGKDKSGVVTTKRYLFVAIYQYYSLFYSPCQNLALR